MPGYIVVRVLTAQKYQELKNSPLVDQRLVVSVKDCVSKEVGFNVKTK